jgi:hypothetical protein
LRFQHLTGCRGRGIPSIGGHPVPVGIERPDVEDIVRDVLPEQLVDAFNGLCREEGPIRPIDAVINSITTNGDGDVNGRRGIAFDRVVAVEPLEELN